MGAAARFFQEANARFTASATTADLHFVMTPEGKGANVLKALRRTDGSEAASISLGTEKEPRYEVDAFTNAVYLAEGDGVKGYRP